MKKQILILSLLSLVVLVQFAVPLQMIRSQEQILKKGVSYRFLTQPFDPSDPFQGRYVWLSIQNTGIPCDVEEIKKLERHQTIYAHLSTTNGFAYFSGWSLEKPDHGDYFKTKIRYLRTYRTNSIELVFPFNEFYMNEEKAPQAEKVARTNQGTTNCWATIRFLNGKGALENVYINGAPIETQLQKTSHSPSKNNIIEIHEL